MRFVENDHRIVERAATHKGERGYLNDIRFYIFLQFGRRYHFLQSVVERAQIGVDFFFHVARQKSQFFARLHCGAAEDEFLDLLVFQRTHGERDGGVGLARTGGADGEQHVVRSECLYEFALIGRARRDGAAARAVNDGVGIGIALSGAVLEDIDDVLLCEPIVLGAVAVECGERFVERRHVFFAADDAHHVVAGHDAQLGAKGAEQAQVGIVGAVKERGVGGFYQEMLFCHIGKGILQVQKYAIQNRFSLFFCYFCAVKPSFSRRVNK